MSDLRRRAWECAFVLMDEFRDRLEPRSYGLCRAALRTDPDCIDSHRARRIHGIYSSLVEGRQ